ncbi:MAG: hypothetical protein IKI76_02895 [Selenomonadaceae bacterium]|nr:hypothetical protein [Selenomonadaceae bacterium]MBR6711922.1 hypothetical protein [Selenomonadaceae bacterium]
MTVIKTDEGLYLDVTTIERLEIEEGKIVVAYVRGVNYAFEVRTLETEYRALKFKAYMELAIKLAKEVEAEEE